MASVPPFHRRFFVLVGLSALLPALSPALPARAEEIFTHTLSTKAEPVTVSIDQSGGSSTIDISSAKKIIGNAFLLSGPTRLVIDLTGVSAATKEIAVRKGAFFSLRVGSHPGKARLVFDLDDSSQLALSATQNGNALRVTLAPKESGPVAPVVTTPTTALTSTTQTSTTLTTSLSTNTTRQTTTSTSTTTTSSTAATRNTTSTTLEEVAVEENSTTTSSMTSTTQRAVIEESIQPPVNPQTEGAHGSLQAMSYQPAPSGGGPAIRFEVANLKAYTLNQQQEDLFDLVLEGVSIGGKFLTLPQFPPDSFVGFTVISAEQSGSNTIVHIYVDEGVKLAPYRTEGELWVKVDQ